MILYAVGAGLYFFNVGALKRSLARVNELPRSVRIVLIRDFPIFSIFVLWKLIEREVKWPAVMLALATLLLNVAYDWFIKSGFSRIE